MKKVFCLIICAILLCGFAFPAAAAEQQTDPVRKITVLDNGITLTEELMFFDQTRASTKTGQKTVTATRSGKTIAVITIQATFSYDGSSVSVVSKSVTQKTTYDGWSYSQQSFTSSGGTVTLNAKLTKLLVLTQPVTVKLTCDKNGNIT